MRKYQESIASLEINQMYRQNDGANQGSDLMQEYHIHVISPKHSYVILQPKRGDGTFLSGRQIPGTFVIYKSHLSLLCSGHAQITAHDQTPVHNYDLYSVVNYIDCT